MKTDFNFENAKVGDEVYHVNRGWTTIENIYGEYFEVVNDGVAFFMDGKANTIDTHPTIYPYNPFEQNQERVVEVSDDNLHFVQRTLILILPNNMAMCWSTKKHAVAWPYWREIEPQKELTQEEKINILWEKYAKDIC